MPLHEIAERKQPSIEEMPYEVWADLTVLCEGIQYKSATKIADTSRGVKSWVNVVPGKCPVHGIAETNAKLTLGFDGTRNEVIMICKTNATHQTKRMGWEQAK